MDSVQTSEIQPDSALFAARQLDGHSSSMGATILWLTDMFNMRSAMVSRNSTQLNKLDAIVKPVFNQIQEPYTFISEIKYDGGDRLSAVFNHAVQCEFISEDVQLALLKALGFANTFVVTQKMQDQEQYILTKSLEFHLQDLDKPENNPSYLLS